MVTAESHGRRSILQSPIAGRTRTRSVTKSSEPVPVSSGPTSRRGRPRKLVSPRPSPKKLKEKNSVLKSSSTKKTTKSIKALVEVRPVEVEVVPVADVVITAESSLSEEEELDQNNSLQE